MILGGAVRSGVIPGVVRSSVIPLPKNDTAKISARPWFIFISLKRSAARGVCILNILEGRNSKDFFSMNRIRTNSTNGEFLFLPMEIEVTSTPGIYSPQVFITYVFFCILKCLSI